MPFVDRSAMSEKLEFVRLVLAEDMPVSVLCRRFGIGRTCAYKLIGRYRVEGEAGLVERSRRPYASPGKSPAALEAAAVAIRQAHPAWGGRKIAKVLERKGWPAPSPSTVTGILRRNGIELGRQGGGARPFIRFEHAAPNDLWQMDFKGDVAMRRGRLHPLTVLDDHSRFSVALEACPDQTAHTVKERLIKAFRRYGLPGCIAVDNGPPWGDGGRGDGFTGLTVWLIEQQIVVSHSRPLHPQTLGKDERFHRTLKAEAMAGTPFEGIAQAQHAFDAFRHVYNAERPHEALGGGVPITRYRPSPRDFKDRTEPFDYTGQDIVRRVQNGGQIAAFGRKLRIGRAFAGKLIALRPTAKDGFFEAFFRHQKITSFDLNRKAP
jgi:transposase InsO family protein